MRFTQVTAMLIALSVAFPVRAAVVINEIFYHAPDDLDNLQFLELYNTGEKAVDLAGWKLTRGVNYTFPAKSVIEANGYLVLCKNLKEFRTYYGFAAAGEFDGSLRPDPVQIPLV